jgi:hypothetical protein
MRVFVSLFLLFLISLAFFLFYVLIYGTHSCHRGDCIGSLYQFLFVRMPVRFSHFILSKFPWLDFDSLPRDDSGKRRRCRHFIAVLFGSIYVLGILNYYTRIYPHLDEEFPFPRAMKWISYFVTPWPVVLYFVFQFVNPGEITNTNVLSYLALYPADGKLYCDSLIPGTVWPAVPRAHYCRWTNRWIAKFDHYCPWVAQPIGERTFRLFLLFLVSCVVISVVGCAGYGVHYFKRVKEERAEKGIGALVDVALRGIDWMWTFSGLVGVAVILLGYIGMLCWQCSRNLTSLEMTKKKQWERQNPGERFVNAYDKGFWENWRLVLWPPIARQHPPFVPQVLQRFDSRA